MGKQNTDLLPGGVTQAEIDKWKSEHKDVFKIDVKDDDGKIIATGYFKSPNRATIGAAMKFIKDNPVRMNEIIMQNCWLGGDKEMQTDDSLFMSASTELAELFQIRAAEIKKL